MPDSLFETPPPWLSGQGPESAVVVSCECSLLRNLADFPFPNRCSEDELRAIEERVVQTLENLDFLESGRYCRLTPSAPGDATGDAFADGWHWLRMWRFLEERRLLALPEQPAKGHRARIEQPRGSYVSDDQSMSIMINGAEHLCLRVLTPGLQVQEAWARLNLADDTLAHVVDYAYDERYGYLMSDLGHVGTGLKAGVILHLPALGIVNGVAHAAELAKERGQVLRPLKPCVFRLARSQEDAPDGSTGEVVCECLPSDLGLAGPGAKAGDRVEGDLYGLSNAATLGLSEEEITFHVRHLAEELAAREQETRQMLLREDRIELEDRVARALGIARNARLLGFAEALEILSSIRLGAACALAPGYDMAQLNELLIASQSMHLKNACMDDCDELALSASRADLFRKRFAVN